MGLRVARGKKLWEREIIAFLSSFAVREEWAQSLPEGYLGIPQASRG